MIHANAPLAIQKQHDMVNYLTNLTIVLGKGLTAQSLVIVQAMQNPEPPTARATDIFTESDTKHQDWTSEASANAIDVGNDKSLPDF